MYEAVGRRFALCAPQLLELLESAIRGSGCWMGGHPLPLPSLLTFNPARAINVAMRRMCCLSRVLILNPFDVPFFICHCCWLLE
jgi:hypothetical protein